MTPIFLQIFRRITLKMSEQWKGENKMDIPIKAEVYCADGLCGHSACVILNPVTEQVTHLVVRENSFPFIERLVPVEFVIESTPHRIRLRCTREKLNEMDSFTESEFIPSNYYPHPGEPWMLWPYVTPEEDVMPLEHQRIPPGELAVHRGTHVQAIDGLIGRVDELLVDPTNGHVTHLVLREGHLWGQKDITIPVSEIDRIENDTVYLKLDKHAIEALPATPIHRRSRSL